MNWNSIGSRSEVLGRWRKPPGEKLSMNCTEVGEWLVGPVEVETAGKIFGKCRIQRTVVLGFRKTDYPNGKYLQIT